MSWILVGVAALIYLALLAGIIAVAGWYARKRGSNIKRWRWSATGAWATLSVVVFSWMWFVNPLPSDEYMIKHFQEYRAVYDHLVKGAIMAAEENKDGNRALQKWMVNPETQKLKEYVQARDDWHKEPDTAWQFGVMANVGTGDRKNIAYTIEFHLAGATKRSVRELSIIWKSYWYFPEAQQLTEGKSLCPLGSGKRCLGQMNIEVLSSLDDYPLFAQVGGDRERWCGTYVRQLDEHWFLTSQKACL